MTSGDRLTHRRAAHRVVMKKRAGGGGETKIVFEMQMLADCVMPA